MSEDTAKLLDEVKALEDKDEQLQVLFEITMQLARQVDILQGTLPKPKHQKSSVSSITDEKFYSRS